MGTRFIAAEESLASDEYKQMVVAATFEDLVLSDALTGAKAYYLRQSLQRMGYDPDNLESGTDFNLANSQERIKAWRDAWSAGHGVGSVTEIAPMADIVGQLIAEYNLARSSDRNLPEETDQDVA